MTNLNNQAIMPSSHSNGVQKPTMPSSTFTPKFTQKMRHRGPFKRSNDV